ncbi:TPA: DUF3265 domain-containing protein [Vibrio vulnificus]|nr:DUF3265 domain-containing protein [Vibrio vulnificus]HDY7933354.1 DUF3265 domain-containing protein [Vibrio vulnificus]HDY7988115.1 DUF3265 domain-containing protein [Vibrio vulnificus]
MKLKHNKAFKRDSRRVAFWVCSEFCGESGLRKAGLGGTHPLTQRYVIYLNRDIARISFQSNCISVSYG